MRHVLCLSAAIAMVGVTSSADAQINFPNPATDLEIFAAYCVGVLSTKIGNRSPSSKWTDATAQTQFSKFKDYLAVRGILSSQRGNFIIRGVNYAAESGRGAENACSANRDICGDQCVKKYEVNSAAFGRCLDVCLVLPQCRSPDRCMEPIPQLPF